MRRLPGRNNAGASPISTERLKSSSDRIGSIVSHLCTERKDGAPSPRFSKGELPISNVSWSSRCESQKSKLRTNNV